MTRHWEIDKEFFGWLAAVWGAGWFLAFVVTALVFRDHRGGHDDGAAWVHSPIHWILPMWLGPFAFVALVFGVVRGLPLVVRHLRANAPIRRVTKPVMTDLREARHD